MFEHVVLRGKKHYPKDNILYLNNMDIQDLNNVENLEKMVNLKELHLQNNKLTSIISLKNLRNLKLLQLNDNLIEELSGLDTLKDLETLDLSNNNINEIKGLENLHKLEKLDLSNNKIIEVKDLENLINLKEIILSNNHIKKISGITTTTKLEKLFIAYNKIEKLGGLENLEVLKELYIRNNNIKKIEGLDNLVNLRELDLRSNEIEKIEGLENLSNLYRIRLEGNNIPRPILEQFYINGKYYVKYCRGEYVLYNNCIICTEEAGSGLENIKDILTLNNAKIQKISDIKNLENLTRLEGLNLVGNEITEIERLNSLTNLKLLWLSHNKIKKIQNLENLINLEYLSFFRNKIHRIEGLNTLYNLQKLNLGENNIRVIENLENLLELRTLSLTSNKIVKITGLSPLVKLEELALSKNKIRNINGLSNLKNLKGLILLENMISNIDDLSNLTNLRILNLGNNQISDIKSLKSLINLTELNLANNRLESIEDLSNLMQLNKLGLENNKIKDISGLKNLINLSYINLEGNPINDKLKGLQLSNNNPRRYIAYSILLPIINKLEDRIEWKTILEEHSFLAIFHLNEIKIIGQYFPDVEIILEKCNIKAFATHKYLAKELDKFIESYREQEDISYEYITEKLHLQNLESAKKLSQIIINKGLSKFLIYDTMKGIRKKNKIKDKFNMKTKKNIDVLIYTPTFEELTEFKKVLPNAIYDLFASNKKIFPWPYDKGTIIIEDREYIIHLISPQKAGQRIAQTLMNQALQLWKPKFILLAGVAGSLRKAQIGDIILPRKILIYDLYKKTPNGEEPQPDSIDTSAHIVLLAERFFSRENWDEKVTEDYFNHLPSEQRLKKNKCFGDGNVVSSVELLENILGDSDAISKYLEFDRKLYGIEQEASGIGEALKYLNIPWLDIRVVMDLADPESRSKYKDKNKQQASKLAADFSISFVKYYLTQIGIPEDSKKDKEGLIKKLKFYEDKIHRGYPFENIIIRYMDSSYYKYIKKYEWERAKNQLVYKLNLESNTIVDILKKIINVKIFLNSKERIESFLDSDDTQIQDLYRIPIENLSKGIIRGSPNYRNHLSFEIVRQINNLDFISINIQSLFSYNGIFIFLTEEQEEKATIFRDHIRKYHKQQFKESLNINLEVNKFETKELEQTIKILHKKIESERINEIESFLNEIQVCLAKILNEFI